MIYTAYMGPAGIEGARSAAPCRALPLPPTFRSANAKTFTRPPPRWTPLGPGVAWRGV